MTEQLSLFDTPTPFPPLPPLPRIVRYYDDLDGEPVCSGHRPE